MSRSESTEDHLERIQELIEQKGYARVADLAASLKLSVSAVSNMVRRLAPTFFPQSDATSLNSAVLIGRVRRHMGMCMGMGGWLQRAGTIHRAP